MKIMNPSNEKNVLQKAKDIVTTYRKTKSPEFSKEVNEPSMTEEQIIERHIKNNPESKFAKEIPGKYDDNPNKNLSAKEQMQENIKYNTPEIDDDVENVLTMMSHLANMVPSEASKLMPLAGKLISKLGNKKFDGWIIETILNKLKG